VESTSQASSPANRPVAGAAQAGAGAAPGNALNLRADPHPALDAVQPTPASSQQQLKPAGHLPVAKAPHAIPKAAGEAGQPHGDSVRGKAVAILGLALTSPTDLTPQEAAVALEAAVFAHFAEHGEPGMRSVTLAHCFQVTGRYYPRPYHAFLACLSMAAFAAHKDSALQHELVYSQNNSCPIANCLQPAVSTLTEAVYDL